MSDYTPTTEEVRFGYSIKDGGLSIDWLQSEQVAEFDRWLAEVKAKEAKAERERIKQRLWDDGYLYEMERDHVWALIEAGNQNEKR